MVQGTSSSAGKSLLVTALCHHYTRQGIRVAPFKAQNMSNNAAVCPDGSEIGRAQAVQAAAAGLQPSVEMNPVLIKPEADARSQVIVMGRPWKRLDASSYYPEKEYLWDTVTSALDRLRSTYQLVIIEGAGSPVELNLKDSDIVNMAVARYADAPVILVGDIDRGGIFAQLLGTYWLLPDEERHLLAGFVINKFRGDFSLFADGLQILEKRSNIPVLGVVPYLPDLYIPEEDAVALETLPPVHSPCTATVDIAVIHLPRISNFDDFDPLLAEPGARLRYVHKPTQFGEPDAVILPGTKSTMADLGWLWNSGLADRIQKFASSGGSVVGICGGYQMLGESVTDPARVESRRINGRGLSLLPVRTRFSREKMTYQTQAVIHGSVGWLRSITGQEISGYEIHQGRTRANNTWLRIQQRNQTPVDQLGGSISRDGRIWGCYLHGAFHNQNLRQAWLSELGADQLAEEPLHEDPFLASLTLLTDTVETALNLAVLEEKIWAN
jgi:adenosylcobyric acid synthase